MRYYYEWKLSFNNPCYAGIICNTANKKDNNSLCSIRDVCFVKPVLIIPPLSNYQITCKMYLAIRMNRQMSKNIW